MNLLQQTANCSDFDVVLDGAATPAFRVLLPEWIRGEGVAYKGLFHQIPGRWTSCGPGTADGRFGDGSQLELAVSVEPAGPSAIRARLEVTNLSPVPLKGLSANLCASINHLPGTPSWSNGEFLPHVEPDRSAQGRYWYEKVAPRGLLALTGEGWTAMHPNPANPDASRVPLYSFVASPAADALGCAVEAPGGGLFFYQVWDAPCRWCAPCPGNACMHMEPAISPVLEKGQRAAICGQIGLARGDRDAVRRMMETFARRKAP